jgi:hypothetical protein
VLTHSSYARFIGCGNFPHNKFFSSFNLRRAVESWFEEFCAGVFGAMA